MTEQFEQQLLGYLLEALSEEERLEIDRAIDREPALLKELDRLQGMLAPLAADADPYTPPRGLADATCAMIAEFENAPQQDAWLERFESDRLNREHFESERRDAAISRVPAGLALNGHHADHHQTNGKQVNGHQVGGTATPAGKVVGMSPVTSAELSNSGRRRFTLREFVTVFALASVALAMLFPAISYSRYNSEVAGCQDNLRQMGVALSMYSDSHAGNFPSIPTGILDPAERKLGVAGIFAPKLASDGLLTDARLLTCPATRHQEPVVIPSMQQVIASVNSLADFQEHMAGDYGYSLGYIDGNGTYVPTKNCRRDFFAVMGDSPSLALDGDLSKNHGGWGQNVLFESGRVAFLRKPDAGVDNPFLNDNGVVAAGLHWGDAVIAPSFARPGVYAMK